MHYRHPGSCKICIANLATIQTQTFLHLILQQPHAARASLRSNEILTGQTAGRRVFRQLSVLAAIYLARPDLMWIGNSEVLGPPEGKNRGTELHHTSFALAKQEMAEKRNHRATKFAWFRSAHAKAKAKAKAKAAAKAKAQANSTDLPRLTRRPDLLPRAFSFDEVYERGLRESPLNPIISSNLMPKKNRLAALSFLEEETSTTGTVAAAAEQADAEVEKNTTQQVSNTSNIDLGLEVECAISCHACSLSMAMVLLENKCRT